MIAVEQVRIVTSTRIAPGVLSHDMTMLFRMTRLYFRVDCLLLRPALERLIEPKVRTHAG